MYTEHFIVDKDKPDSRILARAAVILKRGGLVVFPTETVYGLGANGLDERAVAGIYKAKGRPSDNPLILHVADRCEVDKLVCNVSANAKALMDKFWPGPLTVVLRRKKMVPDIVTGGLETVAIRLPDSIVARELIRLAGVPIAAPSANTSGRPSPTNVHDVLADLCGKIDAVLDTGACTIGVESTVVDCTTPVPTLLRPGGITLEMLVETLGEVEVAPTLAGHSTVPRAPGMKYTHYAPNAPMILVEGVQFQVIVDTLHHEMTKALAQGKKVGAIVSSETAAHLPCDVITVNIGSREDVNEIAANLYTALRYFDDMPVDIIYAEGISETGIGLAVMNRLRKASGYCILDTNTRS